MESKRKRRQQRMKCSGSTLTQWIYCCCCSVAGFCPTLSDPMDCSMPGFPALHYLPEFAKTLVMIFNHLILCHLLLLSSVFPGIRVFSNELALKWPTYCSFSFSFNIRPSNEYSRLISFRIEWFDLLAPQGTLKSLLQYNNSKASILLCSAFFMVQLSHPYMTTGKITALIIQTFFWQSNVSDF